MGSLVSREATIISRGTEMNLVGDLGVDLLAGGLLVEVPGAVGDLLGRVVVDVVARLLGAHREG